MTIFSSLYGARLDRELGTDDTAELFTTARRKAAINEGQEEFAELTECYARTKTVTLTAAILSTSSPLSQASAEINLNSTVVIPDGDFLRFSKEPVSFVYTDASSNVTVLSGEDFVHRTVEDLSREDIGWQVSTTASTVSQMPQAYYDRMDGGAHWLGVWPAYSTGSSATAQVIVPYLAKPQPLSSGGDEPFTVSGQTRTDLRLYHQALVHYAAHQLEKLRRDDQASDRQLQKFLGYVQRYWQNSRRRGGTTIQLARKYFRPRRPGDERRDPRT